MTGKGDRYRPVDKDKFDENYERIFGKEESKCQTNTSAQEQSEQMQKEKDVPT